MTKNKIEKQKDVENFLANFPNYTIQYFADDKYGKGDSIAKTSTHFDLEEADQMQKSGHQVFFSINGFKEGKKDPTNINAVYVDIDVSEEKNIPLNRKAIVADYIIEPPLSPHLITKTKNSYHLIWLVKDIKTEFDFVSVTKKLTQYFEADDSELNINKVLQLPESYYFRNPKNPSECILLIDNSRTISRYGKQEILENFDSENLNNMKKEKKEYFSIDDSDENEEGYSPHRVSKKDIYVTEALRAKNNLKITTSDELLAITPKPQPYIIETLIPENAITAITAESGTGKSLFALILGHHIATGTKLFDKFEVEKKKVLYIDLEMDEDIIVSRYKSIVNEKEDLDFVHNQIWKIDEPLQYDWLKNTITTEGYDVVILDTLTNIHNKTENSADEMKLVNEELLRLIRETGVTIIFLHHNRKPQRGESRNQNSSRGSTEIINKVSSYLMLRSSEISVDENGNFINSLELSQLKARRPEHMKEIGFNVLHNKETNKTTWNYVGYIDKKKKAIEKASEKITELFKKGDEEEYTLKELSEIIKEVGESNIRAAVKKLVEEKMLIFHFGTGSQNNTKFYFLIEE